MNARSITYSISCALNTTYDKSAALKRLSGYVNQAGTNTLHIKDNKGSYSFYAYDGKDELYLKKSSPELYRLARKRYCSLLIKLLEASDEKQPAILHRIETLLMKYEAGRLDLPRIVWTTKQYNWYTGKYVQKPQSDTGHKLGDDFVKSKSEQNIGLNMMDFAIPFHYEEQLTVYVKPLVDKIAEVVQNGSFHNWKQTGPLFYYKGKTCYWNVPPVLQWMNAPGSIWKTYNYRTGKITIHPDFKIIWADGTVKLWEHEGMNDNPIYRCNTSERVSVLETSGAIDSDDLSQTLERDVDDKQRLTDIITQRILPGLWW